MPPCSPDQASAFAAFFRAHFVFVHQNLRRLGVPPAAVEDAAQEVFLVVLRRSDAPITSIRGWLFGIVRRIAWRFRRGAARRERLVQALSRESEPHQGDDAALLDREAAELLERFLARLDDDKRAVFVLAELEQQTAGEIASTLGIKENTVYSRLRAARQEFDRSCARLRLREQRAVEREAVLSRARRAHEPSAATRERVLACLIGPGVWGMFEGAASAARGPAVAATPAPGLLAGLLAAIAVVLALVIGGDVARADGAWAPGEDGRSGEAGWAAEQVEARGEVADARWPPGHAEARGGEGGWPAGQVESRVEAAAGADGTCPFGHVRSRGEDEGWPSGQVDARDDAARAEAQGQSGQRGEEQGATRAAADDGASRRKAAKGRHARGGAPGQEVAPVSRDMHADAANIEASASQQESPATDDLAREAELLAGARRAIREGAWARALELLDAHAREFPNGVLRDERWVSQIHARCASGQVEAARAEVDRRERERPGSASARKAAALCPTNQLATGD